MDWFKVRVNHVFYDGLNRTEGWAWIKVMSLTAQLEKLPNEKQILSVITRRELKLLTNWCETINKPLSNLLESVLKDAATLEKNREKLKNYRHNSAKKEENVTVSVPMSVPDKKIGEEKIREEKKNGCYSYYSNNIHIITPAIADNISIWLSDVPEEWVKTAIDRAVSANARSWNYIEACLKAWKQKGYIDEKRKGVLSGKQTNADRTVEAVNSYIKSLG